MTSLWVSKKKKAELIELCEQLGLQAEGQLKNDYENILTEHLNSNRAELESDPIFGAYYDTLDSRRSPTKTSLQNSSTDVPTTRSRLRASKERFARESSTIGSTGEESGTSPAPSPSMHERTLRSSSRQLSNRGPRTVRAIQEVVELPLPPTPAVLADVIESRVNAIMDSAKRTIDTIDIQEKATELRDKLSNVVSVNAVTLTYEAVFLLYKLIPLVYLVTIPAVPSLGMSAYSFHLPDFFVLLTAGFWGPFLTWFTTSVLMPLGNAYFFNLTATAANVARSTKPYDPAASTTAEEYKTDPLTFAVTKALVAYLVHYKGFDFMGLLGDENLKIVGTGVGKDTQLIGSGIAGLAAVWESVLRR